MPVYLRSQDAITAFGNGCGEIIIRQLSAMDGSVVGEVSLTIEQFQDLWNFEKVLTKEANDGQEQES